MQITELKKLEKGKLLIGLLSGEKLIIYAKEGRRFHLTEGAELSDGDYQAICGIIGKRAKKRALHLLEQMDRTVCQLREKLMQNGYTEEAVEEAIAYAESFHYLDDLRYAKNYIQIQQEKKSRQRLMQDLMKKGVEKGLIEEALAEEFEADEREQIRMLLEKRRFYEQEFDQAGFRKMYQFLMRRGFLSSDILFEMKRGNHAGTA